MSSAGRLPSLGGAMRLSVNSFSSEETESSELEALCASGEVGCEDNLEPVGSSSD